MALQKNPFIGRVEHSDSNAATGLTNSPLVEIGTDAGEYVHKEVPSVIIIDIMMPRIGGLEVIRPIEHTDSNTATGLVDNFLKKVQPRSRYQIREADARTVNYYVGNIESSTSETVDIGFLVRQANSIFGNAKEEIFEDGMESGFSRNLSDFIVSFGHSAMEAIIPLMLSERTNTEVASEAFRILGRLNHKTTYRDRLWLLERGLYSASARVRDGAILGLAFLNDPLAIAPLKSAIERELNLELRKDMEQILAQLEGIEDGIPAKKDKKK